MTHPWRQIPQLQQRFLADYPDDLQVIVHDGGPRLTDRTPELIWVRVTNLEADVFTARVLNQPQQLLTVKQGSCIQFVLPSGGEHPVMVTQRYLGERPDWIIHPCDRCGLSELFDAPSDLMRKVFPDLPSGAVMETFTAFCAVCGGVQVVQHKSVNDDMEPEQADMPAKKWWEFWR